MTKQIFKFSNASTDIYFAGGISHLKEIIDVENAILITDENVFAAHQKRFRHYKTIVLKAGEAYKVQSTIDNIARQLIELDADRKTTLVGVGGGVVTDITGFVASIYMRGIKFGFIPTTLLALADASIGGKNGIDVGVYKNIVGVTRQPAFILQDLIFLNTLPENEWQSGFAEIIKHACIRDATMFKELRLHSINYYRNRKKEVCALIQRNAKIKLRIVRQDEFEKGDRKLLNFGHTIGHAIENTTGLAHGKAISIGMHAACKISELINNFDKKYTQQVIDLLQQYDLPVSYPFDKDETWKILVHDKKKAGDSMNFVVLNSIGHASVKSVPLDQLHKIFNSI